MYGSTDSPMNPDNHARRRDTDDDWELARELKPVEARLASLRPRQDRLDRDRLIFLAGEASAAARPSPRLLGMPLEHRGWPAAFASMTAIAAALSALVVTKGVVEEQPLPAPVITRTDFAQNGAGDDVRPAILTVADAFHLTVEQLLARADHLPRPLDPMSAARAEISEREILTPRAWQTFVDSPAAGDPSSSDSSRIVPFEGVQS